MVSATDEYVGYSGTGVFTQIGRNQYAGRLCRRARTLHRLQSLGQGHVYVKRRPVERDGGRIRRGAGTGLFTRRPEPTRSAPRPSILGSASGGSGTYNLVAGTLNATEYVGQSGTGLFNQTGGTATGGWPWRQLQRRRNLQLQCRPVVGHLGRDRRPVRHRDLQPVRRDQRRHRRSLHRLRLDRQGDLQSVGRAHNGFYRPVFGVQRGQQRHLRPKWNRRPGGPRGIHRL